MFPLFEGLSTLVTDVVPLLWTNTLRVQHQNKPHCRDWTGSSLPLPSLTCVDEFDVALQVSVDHEDLVAAWVRTRSLPHLLVMLLDVLLEIKRPRSVVLVSCQRPLLVTKGGTGVGQRSVLTS